MPVQPQSTTNTDDAMFTTSESSYKTSHTAVRKARRFALQGIYEWLMTDYHFEKIGHREWKSNSPTDIASRTRATNAMHTVHLGYYHEFMREIPAQLDELDELIAKYLDRKLEKLDTIEHAILLIGTYELKHSLHVPYKVVLDEAMKLNTHFGATDAHKLINAVLDKMANDLRMVEVQAEKNNPKNNKLKQNQAIKTNHDKTITDNTEPKIEITENIQQETEQEASQPKIEE